MDLLARPVYEPLWAAARRRVEANGLSLDGTPLTLKGLTGEESDAVAGLLGVRRPTTGSPVRVSLVALDRALRGSSVGRGLLDVLTELGGPLVDRRAAQMMNTAVRAEDWATLGAHPAVGLDDRLTGWLEQVRKTGFDRRLAGARGAAAVRTALDVLAVLVNRVADGQQIGGSGGDGTASRCLQPRSSAMRTHSTGDARRARSSYTR